MRKRFKKLGKKKNKELDLDITSLLDILVILLVFLLKSYNASDLKIDLVSALELPDSVSTELGQHAIIVQVNKDKEMFIDNKSLGSIAGISGTELPSLLEKLNELKEEEEKKELAMGIRSPSSDIDGKAKNKRRINIVLDKELNYATMRQIMHTAAIAGFPQFKFIVKGKYQ